MKKIFKSILVIALFAGITSCEDEKDLMLASPEGEFRILSPVSGEGVALSPETPTNPGLSLTWEAMDYTTPTEVTYVVEADFSGENFDTPVTLVQTTNTFAVINSSDLNAAALAAGLVPFEEGALDIRVKSSIGNDTEVLYSDTIAYLVTPYTTETPKMYVVGNFLNASGYGSDWTPSNAVPLSASGFGETDFEGYVYMNVGSIEYKILPTNESFDGDYGDDGTFTGTLVQEGESNINLTGPGYFKINVTTNGANGTYTATPTSWAVTGDATPAGWPDNGVQDTDMTYDPATKKWSVTLNLTGGKNIKFRANDAWTLNYGDSGADGSLNEGGSDIAVATSGNYTIILDLSNPREYTYTLQAN